MRDGYRIPRSPSPTATGFHAEARRHGRGPSKAVARDRLDAHPKDLPFGAVDGEERCAHAGGSTRRVVLRALAVPSRGLRVNPLPLQSNVKGRTAPRRRSLSRPFPHPASRTTASRPTQQRVAARDRHGTTRIEPRAQGPTFDPWHRVVRPSVQIALVDHRNDVRLLQPGGERHLVREPFRAQGGGELGGEYLRHHSPRVALADEEHARPPRARELALEVVAGTECLQQSIVQRGDVALHGQSQSRVRRSYSTTPRVRHRARVRELHRVQLFTPSKPARSSCPSTETGPSMC
jgi:hypothetical protein